MSCTNIHVRMHGLDDEHSDLVIEGRCGDCNGTLWMTCYSPKNLLHLTYAELHSITAQDVKLHAELAKQHTCLNN